MTAVKLPTGFFLTPESQPKSSVNGDARPFLAHRDTRRATIIVKRTVVGPFVNRHTLEEDTINIDVRGVPHIRIPNRKLKAVEKNRVLRAARFAGIMPPEYLTNEIQEIEHLGNPVSLVFGDGSNKSNEVAGVPGRVMFSQGVSVQPKAGSIEHITHNALSDERTMRNVATKEKGKTTMRTSLFETHYVKEGTVFLSTVTIDTPTRDMLAVVLYGLQAGSYGAGTNVYGTNIRNEVLGIAFTHHELPLTPWSFLNDHEHSLETAGDAFAAAAQALIGTGTFLDKKTSLALQQEMAGDRAQVEAALAAIQEHCGPYISTVFGSK